MNGRSREPRERSNATMRQGAERIDRFGRPRLAAPAEDALAFLKNCALNLVREAVYLIDESARFVYVNDEACRTLGYESEQLLEMRVMDVDPDWSDQRWNETWHSLRENGLLMLESTQRRNDGSTFPVDINASYFEHDDKQYNLVRVRDITERVQAELQLRESYAQLQELTAMREAAREDERKRIAREMHDELGQQLTALRLGVSALRVEFATDNPALSGRLQDLLGLADQTMHAVRNVIASLRPAALDAGIVAALEWLAAEFSRDGHLDCRLRIPDENLVLDEERAVALFRISQEALTNVARHAKATHVTISLERFEDYWILEIRDNGHGFESTATPRKTFGLVGMKERAQMLGGEISIESASGHGTAIVLRIPIDTNPDLDGAR